MGVRVVTDSACDLPPDLCDERGIEVVPLTVRFGDEELVDRVELSNAEFWKRMETTDALPETSAPSVGAFEEVFRRLADEGADGVACINLSSRLSATMQSAQVASKALDGLCPIAVIDSLTASMGIGSQALHAAALAADGADLRAIVTEVEDRRDRQNVFATLDTLEFLRRGGRIGTAQAMFGSMLSIKPIITVTDGAVAPAGKVRTRSKALRFVIDQIKGDAIEEICIMHSRAPDIDAFLEMLEPIVPEGTIIVGEIGPVIGVHAGPRVIGATWIEAADS